MKQTIKLDNKKLTKLIKESVTNILTETFNKRELSNQVAREILGTDTFEEFYRNTSLMVGARDLYLMSKYFERLAELTSQMEGSEQPQ